MNTENNMGADSCGSHIMGCLKNRFMIVLILSILVSSALASLYSVNASTANMAYLAIMTPVCYVLTFALFEIGKKKLNDYFLKIVNGLLLLGIVSFVFPLTFVAFFKNVASIGVFMKMILFVAIWGVPLIAMVSLVATLLALISGVMKK